MKPLPPGDLDYNSENWPSVSNYYPKIVIFEIKYFQMTTTFKSIAKVSIGYKQWIKAELDNPAADDLPGL